MFTPTLTSMNLTVALRTRQFQVVGMVVERVSVFVVNVLISAKSAADDLLHYLAMFWHSAAPEHVNPPIAFVKSMPAFGGRHLELKVFSVSVSLPISRASLRKLLDLRGWLLLPAKVSASPAAFDVQFYKLISDRISMDIKNVRNALKTIARIVSRLQPSGVVQSFIQSDTVLRLAYGGKS